MGLRFSRSISLFPGVRLNLGLRGASVSVGGRGLGVNVGRHGVHGNVGLPGTGLSYRTRLDGGTRRPTTDERAVECTARLVGDEIVVEDGNGEAVPDDVARAAMRASSTEIRRMLDEEVRRRNDAAAAALVPRRTAPTGASVPKPVRRPGEDGPGHMARLATWRADRARDVETRLVSTLEGVDWGRETNISCSATSRRVVLAIDLPEIEDMPTTRWKRRARPPGIDTTEMTATMRHAVYANMVATIVRTALDAVFSDMEDVGSVVVDAYTTRSGRDEYVVVVDAARSEWAAQKHEAEAEMALARMGARMQTTSTGRLKPQEPIVA